MDRNFAVTEEAVHKICGLSKKTPNLLIMTPVRTTGYVNYLVRRCTLRLLRMRVLRAEYGDHSAGYDT